MEPVTFAIGGLSWLISQVVQGAPGGSAGFALGTVLSGILGNEAHRLYREATPHILQGLSPLSLPENNDLTRAVRTAQIEALHRLIEDYQAANRATWDTTPSTRPAMFLDRSTVFCQHARTACKSSLEFDLTVTETLRASFKSLLADAVPGGPAELRTEALASFAEDAVLDELQVALGSVAVPGSFEVHFRRGGESCQNFLSLFGAFFSKQIKPDTPARAIMMTKLLAQIEGLAFDSAEILARVEKQFGPLLDAIKDDTAAIKRRQAEDADLATKRHAELKQLVADAAGSGAPAVRAIAEMRNLLRPGNPGIDEIEAERLPGLVQRILEQLQTPTAIAADFSGTVKRALAEAQARVSELAFVDAAQMLDAQLAQIEREDRDRARGRGALLAERGRVANLLLRYREAAGFYTRASGEVAFDPQDTWDYALAAAKALYDQGTEFGDNPALCDAIAYYRELLRSAPRERVPLQWAMTQNNLGLALAMLGERESSTARLDEAVAAYRAALQELTRERVPLDWAATQTNLGGALAMLGERENGTARLEQAVAAFRAALQERPRERVPLDWAATQTNLGGALMRLGERESGTARLDEAVAAYRAALEEHVREQVPLDWAATQTNLGNALMRLGERERSTARLEQAVVAFHTALQEFTRERVPLQWAMTQNNLGGALTRLGERESSTARLDEAVAAYRAALQEWTRERVPLDWAATQTNLGLALAMLGERGSSTARLDEAVAAYRAALKERARERVPLDWAATQNNLGNALAMLGERGSSTARLDEAVAAYRAALQEWTREQVPLDWAATQNNLGLALAMLGERESSTARLDEAVAAYRAALKERARERVPLDWAATQNNLGNALMRLGERESGTMRLEEAVAVYRLALQERTREQVPLQWAATQNNLGGALTRLGERENSTMRLEEAIAAYRLALQEWTRDRVPLQWAMTQMNLGNALMRLGERENGTVRLEEAIVAWDACLAVVAPVSPPEWVTTISKRCGNVQAEIARRTSM